jgi:hypothetical protein
MSLESQFLSVCADCEKISDAWKRSSEDKPVERETYMAFLKEYLSLTESLKEEFIVLRLTNKPSNAKAVRLMAKLILLRDNHKGFLPQKKPEIVPRVSYFPEATEPFLEFYRDRVRARKDGYCEVTGEIVSLKEIYKCYRRWCDVRGYKRMEMKEMEQRCEETFGDSRGKKQYHHIRVFLDDDDVEEFDKMVRESRDTE